MTLFDYHNINFVKLDKSDRLGLVYRGSKRNIADDILKAIYDYNPNAYAFYDLFGGGADYSKMEAYIRDREKEAGKYSLNPLNSLNLLLKSDFSDIEISNKDYREVEIKHNPSDCIIYCDIPYKNTGKYIESLNHNEFYKWCFEKKEQGYNVFVSEYDMPLDFKCIFEKEHIKKIGVQNNLKSIERLYIL